MTKNLLGFSTVTAVSNPEKLKGAYRGFHLGETSRVRVDNNDERFEAGRQVLVWNVPAIESAATIFVTAMLLIASGDGWNNSTCCFPRDKWCVTDGFDLYGATLRSGLFMQQSFNINP